MNRSTLAAILLSILLTACGGGDPEPDRPTPGVDCKAEPEKCK